MTNLTNSAGGNSTASIGVVLVITGYAYLTKHIFVI